MPEISIIIPVYNSEKYLENCLTSLINQTFKDIEIICINDGSTDNSLQILETFKKEDGRIVILNQQNSGPAIARNNGLTHAAGNYIMFCDSDDWYEPNMCEVMLKKIVDENVDIVQCSVNVCGDNNSNRSIIDVQKLYNTDKQGFFQSTNYENKLLFRHELWSKIFKKSIIQKYDLLLPLTKFGEDRAFIMKYLAVSKKAFIIPDKLYNYRLTINSLCENVQNNKYKNVYDTILAMQDVKKFFIQNELMEKNKYYFADKINFSLLAYYGTCDKAHKKDFILKHKELITDIELDEDFLEKYPIINSLKKKDWKKTLNLLEKEENLSLCKNIFSIKNRDIHKVITICGVKLKLKNKKLIKEIQLHDFIDSKFKTLESHLEEIKLQNEELRKGLIFNNLLHHKDWIKDKDIIPAKGSANYSLLYILLVILDKIQPENILEFGFGQTTKLTTQYEKFFKTANSSNTSNGQNIVNKKYDLIIIGSSTGSDKIHTTNILDLIPQNLAEDFVIILDDAEPESEQNTEKLIFEKLDENNIKYSKSYQHASKSQLIITSDKYKFISFY